MYKKSAKYMQRLGLLTGTGVFGKVAASEAKEPKLGPTNRAILENTKRLAKIRRVFELESEISAQLKKGKNVAALRLELAAVKSGAKTVPLALGRDPLPSAEHTNVTVHRRRGTEKAVLDAGEPKRAVRKTSSLTNAAVESDLLDLARGKLSLTGAAIVKVFLGAFDIDTIALALDVRPEFLNKVKNHPMYELSEGLTNADGLVVVDVLERRMKAKFTQFEMANGIGSTKVDTVNKRSDLPCERSAEAPIGDTNPPKPSNEPSLNAPSRSNIDSESGDLDPDTADPRLRELVVDLLARRMKLTDEMTKMRQKLADYEEQVKAIDAEVAILRD